LGGGPDDGFVTLLESAGYNVHAVDEYWSNIDSADVVALDTFDLVIISKATTSGNFGDTPEEIANWMNVNTPVMIMNDFVARNSRLDLFNSGATTANGGLKLDAVLPDHPVFTNTTLVGDSTNEVSIDPLEVIVATDAGNGTVIATDALTGNVTIAEWPANTPFYAGSANTADGPRMYFATDYGYKLTADGDQLLLDAVQYLIKGSVTVQNRLIWVTADAVSDALYISEIEDLGFDVVVANLPASVVGMDPAGYTDSLATAEVVVVSRNTNSGDYANKAFWNNVPTPVLTLSSFLVRKVRWGMSADSLTEVSPDSTVIKVVGDTSTTLFDYLTVTDSLLTLLTSSAIEVAIFDETIGIGNGTLYASSINLGRVAVAEWPANTPFYPGSPDSAADRRMLLALPGTNVLTLDGKQLLSNALRALTGGTTAQVVLTQNYDPYAVVLSPDVIAENLPAGTLVGTLSVMDLNLTDVHALTLAGADAANFSLSNDSLYTAVIFDYEDTTSFVITITADDGNGGSYDQDITVNISNDPSDDQVSIRGSAALEGVRVFPNPFSDLISIEGITAESVSIAVFDLSGRLMFGGVYPRSGAIQVSLKALPQGVYIAKISAESRTTTIKLIRE
jgi:hypothetical protein